jgi:hypothetical protein
VCHESSLDGVDVDEQVGGVGLLDVAASIDCSLRTATWLRNPCTSGGRRSDARIGASAS